MAGIDRAWLRLGGSWLVAALGCRAPDFVCQSNGDCASSSANGICENTGYCSFPDEACPSGQRYGELSGPLSGECTTPGEDSTSSSSASTTIGSASGGPGTSATVGSTVDGTDDTIAPSTGAISDAMSSESSDPTTDAASTGPTVTEDSTAGTMVDPYGPCAEGCTLPGATCLMTNQDETVCASPCEDPTMPGVSCPAPLVDGWSVACASTQMGGGDFCVLLCMDGACPGMMTCRESVCVYP